MEKIDGFFAKVSKDGRKMIKAIIFDLDDTLCNTSSTANDAKNDMVKAMREAGLPNGKIDTKKIYKMSGIESVNFILNSFNLKDVELLKVGLDAYYGHNRKIKLYSHSRYILNRLKSYMLILLTTGIPKMQRKKVENLGIKDYFFQIVYDNILYTDKTTKIKKILQDNKLKPDEVISVGDKISDVIASNMAGVISVHILTGRSQSMPKRIVEKADHTIKDLRELLKLI